MDDLLDRARLFNSCSINFGKSSLPPFETYYQSDVIIAEIDKDEFAHNALLRYLLLSGIKIFGKSLDFEERINII